MDSQFLRSKKYKICDFFDLAASVIVVRITALVNKFLDTPLPSLYFFLFLELITIQPLLKQYMYSKTVILDAISSYFSCHSFRKAALQTSIPKSTLHFWVSKLRSFFDHNFKKRHALHRRTKKREQIYLAVSHELLRRASGSISYFVNCYVGTTQARFTWECEVSTFSIRKCFTF